MENTINFEGKELKWEYTICPCLECPIYPLQKEWENETDIRKNKCWTSRCLYDKMKAKEMADYIQLLRNNYHCKECDKWIPKDELDEKYCPYCGTDLLF
jgi:translation initiation factor 2 beta subunit (eIF-2beta)/eIF-5